MKTILIVDDIKFIKILTRKAIEEKGYAVVGEASDGEEAVQKFRELKPDLVLLDITMPKMDGLTALKRILEIDPQAKVIIASALGHEHVIVQAIRAGAKDFIIKPFTKERLFEAIERAFQD